MDFSLSEEPELFQNTVRGFVANECPSQTLRAVFDGKRQAAPALWRGLAAIAGGTSNIQRNIIGEHVLGLPRDPRPAAR